MTVNRLSERAVLSAINDMSVRLMTLTDRDELFWYVSRDVVGRMGFVDCIIYLADRRSRTLRQVSAMGQKNPTAQDIVNALVIPFSAGITGHVASTGQPLLVDDVRDDPRFIEDTVPALSELCVPFFSDGEVAGVIDCEHPEVGAFTTFHLEVLTTVAAMIGARLASLKETEEVVQRNSRLADNEMRLALALQGANDGLFDWDLKTGSIYYSPRWLDMLGYAPGDLPADYTTFEERLHPDDRLRITTHPPTMNALGRECIESEFRMKHRDGHWVHILSRAFMVRDNTGEMVRLVGTHVDMTERHRAEQSLKSTAHLMNEALRVARMAAWHSTPDGRLIWSPEVYDLLKMRQGDFDGTIENFLEFVHDSDRERVMQEAARAWKELSRYEVIYRLYDGEGNLISLRETAEVVRDAKGRPVRMSGAFQDITEQVEMQSKFNQAQKMEAIGQLTGGVAHDFNNLLAVIQGCAELMQMSTQYEEELIDRIVTASRRGADLTHRLLAFARQQPLAPKTIDVHQMCLGMRQMLRRTFVETIEFKVTTEPGLWPACADQSQVEDALLNLAINARDAMPDGGRLEINSRNVCVTQDMADQTRDAQAGDYVCITVTDTGFGMSEQVQKHAFEPFFSTKEVGKGSGLGLSMVYGFATQSGGHVTLRSGKGEGTSVSIYLPRDTTRQSEPEEKIKRHQPEGRGETVLVIEDDPLVRQLAIRMIKRLGYEVVAAEDALSARALVEGGQRFDVLLSDVVLPGGVSGPELAREIKQQQPKIKIVFMSGYPAEFAAGPGGLDPDQVLLGKPFRWEELAQALRGPQKSDKA